MVGNAMTVDELKSLTEWMREQGVSAFQVTDKGISVAFFVAKPKRPVETKTDAHEVTRAGQSGTKPAEQFDGMDLDVLLHSA
jgi:hypothetical protein